MDSEEPVFEAVITWVKHARKEREASLPDLLQYVRMPLLTPRYITDVVDAEVSAGARAGGAHTHESPRLGAGCSVTHASTRLRERHQVIHSVPVSVNVACSNLR